MEGNRKPLADPVCTYVVLRDPRQRASTGDGRGPPFSSHPRALHHRSAESGWRKLTSLGGGVPVVVRQATRVLQAKLRPETRQQAQLNTPGPAG